MQELNNTSMGVLGTSAPGMEVLAGQNILSEVPFIGTAFQIVMGSDAFRDRAFAIKLMRFVEGIGPVTTQEWQKYSAKLKSNPDEAKRVGETLFIVLENLVDMDKPALLARVFVNYLNGVLSAGALRRLAQMIYLSFEDDLQEVILDEIYPDRWMARVPNGVTAPNVASPM